MDNICGSGHISDSVQFSRSVVSDPSCVRLFAACQASLSISNSQSLLKLMSIELVMPSDHLIVCCPLLQFSIFPSIRIFQMNQFFSSGGQSTGASASASVLPTNIQDWYHLGWIGWLSWKSKGLKNLQHHSSNASILQHSAFFIVQVSHLYMTIYL